MGHKRALLGWNGVHTSVNYSTLSCKFVIFGQFYVFCLFNYKWLVPYSFFIVSYNIVTIFLKGWGWVRILAIFFLLLLVGYKENCNFKIFKSSESLFKNLWILLKKILFQNVLFVFWNCFSKIRFWFFNSIMKSYFRNTKNYSEFVFSEMYFLNLDFQLHNERQFWKLKNWLDAAQKITGCRK